MNVRGPALVSSAIGSGAIASEANATPPPDQTVALHHDDIACERRRARRNAACQQARRADVLQDVGQVEVMVWRKRGDAWDDVEATLGAADAIVSARELQEQQQHEFQCASGTCVASCVDPMHAWIASGVCECPS